MFTRDTSTFDRQTVDPRVVFMCFRHRIWKSWIPDFRKTVFSDFGTPTFGRIFYRQVPCSPCANVSSGLSCVFVIANRTKKISTTVTRVWEVNG